jgi:hypothetical protein
VIASRSSGACRVCFRETRRRVSLSLLSAYGHDYGPFDFSILSLTQATSHSHPAVVLTEKERSDATDSPKASLGDPHHTPCRSVGCALHAMPRCLSCCCASSSPLCSCGTRVHASNDSSGDCELAARSWMTPPVAQSMSTQQKCGAGPWPYHTRHITDAASLCWYGTFVGDVKPLEDDVWFDAPSDLDDNSLLPADAAPTSASLNLDLHCQHHSQGAWRMSIESVDSIRYAVQSVWVAASARGW